MKPWSAGSNRVLAARRRQAALFYFLDFRAATVYGLSHNSNAGHGRLGECARVPTAEPSFHMLGRAIGRPACRAGVANASALPLYAASRHVY